MISWLASCKIEFKINELKRKRTEWHTVIIYYSVINLVKSIRYEHYRFQQSVASRRNLE